MGLITKLLVNISGGELDQLSQGRVDIPLYAKAVKKCENCFVQPQGGWQFRPGTMFVHTSRQNKKMFLYAFAFSDIQAYIIEATEFYFRFYTNNGIVLNQNPFTVASFTALGTTQVSFNVVAHGLNTGGDIVINGYKGGGWDALNSKSFEVTVVDADNFTINYNGSTLAAPTTIGTIYGIYEIATPYFEADLPYLQFAQIADTAYIANNNYEPRKLVRLGNSNWTLNTYTRTQDPFPNTLGAGHANLNAITQANPGVFTTTAAHGFIAGQQITITGVVGMTEVNGLQYQIAAQNFTATTFSIQDLAGNPIDTTGFGAYVSGGVVQASIWPRAVQFDGSGRLIFANTYNEPMSIWASRAPTTAATRYDDFTGGSLATDGLAFTLAPLHGHIDSIQWISSTTQFLVLGTFGSIRALYGSALGQPITPSAITANSVTTYGTLNSQPVANDIDLFYIERGGLRIRSIEYNYISQAYIPTDRNLVATHLTPNGLKQVIQRQGNPDLIFVPRYDGKFLTLTFNLAENISGWARHYLGGKNLNDKGIFTSFAKVICCQSLLRNQTNSLFSGGDQIWFGVERNLFGNGTTRTIEYMADFPIYPIRQDYDGISGGPQFFQGVLRPMSFFDQQQYENAMFESQKTACHLDMATVYDGTQYGTAANATVSYVDGTIGSGRTFTSDNPVFDSSMIGRELWCQYDINGNGGGRGIITAFNSATSVDLDVISEFFAGSNIMRPGNWYLTTKTLTNLDLFDGETLRVYGDGSNLQDTEVANGQIALKQAVSYAVVGYKYQGTVRTLNLDPGSQSGSAQTNARAIGEIGILQVNSLGVQYGDDWYDTERNLTRLANDKTGRASPLYNGFSTWPVPDSWSSNFTDIEKTFNITQENSLPTTIAGLNFRMEVSDD